MTIDDTITKDLLKDIQDKPIDNPENIKWKRCSLNDSDICDAAKEIPVKMDLPVFYTKGKEATTSVCLYDTQCKKYDSSQL